MTATQPATHGLDVLRDPRRNHGVGFTADERAALRLDGLLPPAVQTLELQARRVWDQLGRQIDDLAKNTFLESVRDRNETLYYKALVDHLVDLLPIVYDPVIGRAIERYSHEYRRPRGIYLSVDDLDGVARAFDNLGLGPDEVDLLVCTDAEAILGIGDWGSNGMGIAQGKLAIYTAAAGIHPERTIPVMLDVGTDNEALLNDPLYVGLRHSRTRGRAYDALIARYVEEATARFPGALLHFEDFGPSNARRILTEYTGSTAVFNDDMQGTGAITLAAVLAGVRVSGSDLAAGRLVVFGAGTAGVGIADQLRDAMVRAGATRADATRQVWLVDRQGLLFEDTEGLRDFQVPYARPAVERDGFRAAVDGRIDLAGTVAAVHPSILVGTSTQPGAFTEAIVRDMAAHVDRPLIFPLSNPDDKIEAHPADVIAWTEGAALIGTGTPWPAVPYGGVEYRIGQGNNALLYPGLGLGAVVSRARQVTPAMILVAAEAVAGLVDTATRGAAILPEVDDLRATSATVAVAVVRRAQIDGVARTEIADAVQAVAEAMWVPGYDDGFAG